jgi:hypothetical protein
VQLLYLQRLNRSALSGLAWRSPGARSAVLGHLVAFLEGKTVPVRWSAPQ